MDSNTTKEASAAAATQAPSPSAHTVPHSYVFQLFALNQRIDLPGTFTLDDTVHAIAEHVIARARLDGTYEIR